MKMRTYRVAPDTRSGAESTPSCLTLEFPDDSIQKTFRCEDGALIGEFRLWFGAHAFVAEHKVTLVLLKHADGAELLRYLYNQVLRDFQARIAALK